MGKYSHLKSKMIRFTDPSPYQQEVEKKKEEYLGLGIKELANKFEAMRAVREALEADTRASNLNLEALSQLLVEWLEREGLSKVQLEELGVTLYLKDEPYTSVQDKAALLAWIQEQSMQELLTVNWSTLNAMVKERLVSGEPAPAGLEVFMKSSIGRRTA